MTFLRVLWGIDVFILVIALYFFLTGISTASQGSNFYNAWMGLLAALIGVIGISFGLGMNGHLLAAKLLAGIPAGLVVLYLLFMLVVIFGSGGRWN